RCRGRGSTAEIRSAPTGRPPSTAAALTASPIPVPENPNRVPVPRLPGPCVTTTTSAPSTCLAASRPECTLTASRSPPNACPQVTTPANVSDRSLSVRENHAGNAPPSVMTYATAAPGASACTPATTAGSAECRSAVTTGSPARSSASASVPWCGEDCSSTPATTACNGVYLALTRCPGPAGGSGGSRSGSATTSAYPPVPSPSASASTVSSTRSPTAGSPTSGGYASAGTRRPPSGPSAASSTVSSCAPRQARPSATTRPVRQRTRTTPVTLGGVVTRTNVRVVLPSAECPVHAPNAWSIWSSACWPHGGT